MTIPEALTTVRYVTDVEGKKTGVLIPLAAWEALLAYWIRLVELLEDQEDRAILQEWLEERATGQARTISLDALEQELVCEALAFAEDQAIRRFGYGR